MIKSYTEDIPILQDTARKFCERHIAPYKMEWDENQIFPVEVFKKLGELGFMGILVPEQYGGSGLSYHEYVAIVEQIATEDPSIGLSVAAHNSLCTNHILKFGNEEQKMKWLPKLASGEWIGAWGLTEPNTGSDAGNMKTVAVDHGDHYIINGAKNFITHGKSGDIAVVIVRTGEVGDSHGMTAFAIEKGTPGFKSGKKENKLGMRASETAELIFEDCIVPKENMLGQVGEGFIQSMKILDGGRISIAALSLGIAKGAYEAAKTYSKERTQFGKPIAKFQAVGFKIADMAVKYEAARLLVKEACDKIMNGEKVTLSSAMAKYYASEICTEIANDAIQVHGGYGYLKDFPVEKFYRDSKLCTIGEGTSEIQKLVISKTILDI